MSFDTSQTSPPRPRAAIIRSGEFPPAGRATAFAASRLAGVVIIFLLFVPAAGQEQTQLNRSSTAATASDDLARLTARLRAMQSDPAIVSDALAHGFALLGAARYEDAAAVFGAILDAKPQEQTALYGKAIAFFNLKRLGEAEELARASVAAAFSLMPPAAAGAAQSETVKRRASDALTLLATVLAVKGDNAGALKSVTEAVRLAPANFDAQFALARALYGAGDPAGASEAFRAAVALKPDDAKARFFLATSLEKAGDDAAALAAYRELRDLNVNLAEAHLGIGSLLLKGGAAQLEEAIGALARAVSLNGELYEARVSLGRALIRAGRAADAIEHLRHAALLAPGNPEPHYQLQNAFKRLGRHAEARAAAAHVKQLHEARRKPSAPGTPAAVVPERD